MLWSGKTLFNLKLKITENLKLQNELYYFVTIKKKVITMKEQ